jgi:putative Mn2+ efflux pump MntP
MDAFSVSMAVAAGPRLPRQTFRLTFHFGLFQFFMPLIGGFLGRGLSGMMDAYDHWIAFGILLVIGLNMIVQAIREKEEAVQRDRSKGWSLVFLSTATSIDALGAGLAMGLNSSDLLIPCVIIGLVCGAMSFVGVRLGRRLSRVFGRGAEVLGGITLVFLALQMLFV